MTKGFGMGVTARRMGYGLAAGVSVACIAVIVTLWSMALPPAPKDMQHITCLPALDRFRAEKLAQATQEPFISGPPIEVPTGLFIQSIDFTRSSDVNLTGYIWQKYPVDYPFDMGVTFPEQILSGRTLLREEYRATVTHNGAPHLLIGSYFDVTLRQIFDYSNYPLDELIIWVRLWPQDFDNGGDKILLVPDFDSYPPALPASFGLDQDLVQGEWRVARTFFGYSRFRYDTTFGLAPATAQTADLVYNEFDFNIVVKRKFENAFIVTLVPLFVVALLLYGTILTISGPNSPSHRFGFTTTGAFSTCSALFFVVMLSHIQVRSAFPGSGLVYVEYFYLTMYLAVTGTAVNAYLVARSPKGTSTNAAAKLLFWPVLLSTMAALSFATLNTSLTADGPAPFASQLCRGSGPA